MNLRPASLVLFSLLLAAPQFARAADAAPATPPATPAAPAPGGEEKTELDKRMDRVGKAFRTLRKQVADPTKNASSLELVGTMVAALKEAEGLTPAKADDVPADQRAKFVSDYVAGVKAMEDSLQKLSDTLTAGDNAKAATMVQDIFSEEKKDHKEFRRPEKS